LFVSVFFVGLVIDSEWSVLGSLCKHWRTGVVRWQCRIEMCTNYYVGRLKSQVESSIRYFWPGTLIAIRLMYSDPSYSFPPGPVHVGPLAGCRGANSIDINNSKFSGEHPEKRPASSRLWRSAACGRAADPPRPSRSVAQHSSAPWRARLRS
jgi:hypothetical protein